MPYLADVFRMGGPEKPERPPADWIAEKIKELRVKHPDLKSIHLVVYQAQTYAGGYWVVDDKGVFTTRGERDRHLRGKKPELYKTNVQALDIHGVRPVFPAHVGE